MIKNCPMRHENGNCIPAGGFCTANKNICEALLNAYRMGKAQLFSEGTTSDLISRQAALDAVEKNACNTQRIMDAVNNLPPAQPETLTDKEQRIFLAAMGREEKVCRQVDDECGDCRDSDSLVRTCHEITRKVKGTLWT